MMMKSYFRSAGLSLFLMSVVVAANASVPQTDSVKPPCGMPSASLQSSHPNSSINQTNSDTGFRLVDLTAVSKRKPVIDSFAPTTGAAGTVVTVTGSYFADTKAVSVGGFPAVFTVASDTSLTFTVPPHAKSGAVHVVNSAGLGASTTGFVIPELAMSIDSFSPASGGVGAIVTVKGSGFTGATAASIDGYPTSFTVVDDHTATVTVPARAGTGKVHIKTPEGLISSTTDFVVQLLATITSFSPTSGPVGTVVTVTGTGFNGTNLVSLDGLVADYTVQSDTSLTFTVPDGAISGVIHVTNESGFTAGPTDFTVTP